MPSWPTDGTPNAEPRTSVQFRFAGPVTKANLNGIVRVGPYEYLLNNSLFVSRMNIR